MPEDGPNKYKDMKIKKKDYNIFIIKRKLSEKEFLRKIFLGVAKFEPSRAGEVIEYCEVFNRGEFYNAINVLRGLGIINRKAINEIKNPKTWLDKECLKKFEAWNITMGKKQKNYYHSKTGFYYITKIGNEVLDWACKLEGVDEKPKQIEDFGNKNV